MKIIGDRIYLKLLSPDDVNEKYLNWMRDPQVLQYLECRWRAYSLEELRRYIQSVNDGLNNFMLGIYLKNEDEYIGNIKVGGINHVHRHGDVGLILGEKSVWGKGYGREAVELVTKYAFEEINLNKVIAGIYESNIGSIKAFEKAGYRKVGVLKQHRFCKGIYVDEVLLEKCKNSDPKMK